MFRTILIRVALALLMSSVFGCEEPSRLEFYRPPRAPTKADTQSCPPTPAEPVCPPAAPTPVPECPPPAPAPECPAAPEPPAPVELTLRATPVEPLRAAVTIEWSVRGCTAEQVEVIGEDGQVIDATVPRNLTVASVTRSGRAMIARFSLWARVTCTDGRSSIAGPVAVVDALRAVRVLTPEMEPRVFVEHLLALPNGGLAVTTGSVASNDPSVTLDAVWVLAPDGSSLGCGNNCAALSLDQHTTGTPLPMHPWLEDTHAMVARGDHLRAWVDYVTGENHSALYYDSNPLPAAATSGSPPLPAGLRGWTGIWAPWPDGSGRVWVERNKSFALLDLDE